jgi:hypothetical protein
MSSMSLCGLIEALVLGAVAVATLTATSVFLLGAAMQPWRDIGIQAATMSLAIWAAMMVDDYLQLTPKLCAAVSAPYGR